MHDSLAWAQIILYLCNLKTLTNFCPMSIKVYTVSEPLAIDFLLNEDIDGFKEYLNSDDAIVFNEPEEFATEAEALAFCSGLGYGSDERAVPERYPLRSCEPADIPFIEAIENY